MKTLVKNIIAFVDNNKKFVFFTLVIAVLLCIFHSVEAMIAALFFLSGICFFMKLWRGLEEEDTSTRKHFRILCAGAIFFLSGSLIAIPASLINQTSVWYHISGLLLQGVVWIGGGLVVLFVFIGLMKWTIVPTLRSLVRWAKS